MIYLLKRTYNQDIKKYEKELLDFSVLYLKVNSYDEEERIVTIIEIKSLEEINKLIDSVGRIVVKDIEHELEVLDCELDKNITKLIEIYDDYRE